MGNGGEGKGRGQSEGERTHRKDTENRANPNQRKKDKHTYRKINTHHVGRVCVYLSICVFVSVLGSVLGFVLVPCFGSGSSPFPFPLPSLLLPSLPFLLRCSSFPSLSLSLPLSPSSVWILVFSRSFSVFGLFGLQTFPIFSSSRPPF